MSTFKITKGHDIRILGRAEKAIVDGGAAKRVALQPIEFQGIRPRLNVDVGQKVKLGTELFHDKAHPEIRFVAPGGGTIVAVSRGARRVLTEIILELDGDEEAEELQSFEVGAIAQCTREQIVEALLLGGVWPLLKQRPFGRVPIPTDAPKSIFVQGMDTAPLALDPNVVLEGEDEAFQAGLDGLSRLTDGAVHLCVEDGAELASALANARGVETHRFSGKHPAGNPGTHIHFIDPVQSGETVWHLKAVEVLDMGRLLLTGRHPTERVVALVGGCVDEPQYVRTRVGVSMRDLTEGRVTRENIRYISGTVLNGASVGKGGFVRFADRTVHLLQEGGPRHFLSWASLGADKYTASRAFPSGVVPRGDQDFDTRLHGGPRAIVDIGQYDAVMPLNVMPVPLIKSLIAGDLEEAEKLGMLELVEEDLALCTFVCPSVIDFGEILRKGLDLYEKEG